MEYIIRPLAILGVLGYLLAPAWAMPLPPAGSDPIEANDLRLKIRPKGVKVELGPSADREDWDVTLLLINHSKNLRSVSQLIADGNRLEVAFGITYILRFPDGTILELEPRIAVQGDPWPGSGPRAKPLALPAEGYAQGTFNLCNSLTEDFRDRFRNNKGQFCLTAVVAEIGLQSNTVRYNGCPAPPHNYTPVKHSRFTPEARQKAELQRLQRAKEERERIIHELIQEHLRRQAERQVPPDR